MKYLDLTFSSPAENLACDEALLDHCEENSGPDILRFWESTDYFVVVGYANKIACEVNVAACEKGQIPIYRRCTGGGTVLQGRGCMNYSLILETSRHPALQSISSTNQFILERNRMALQPLVSGEVSLRGQTDLALGDRKFSGNSQRRKKNCVLFHGTFLLSFDLPLIEEYLISPSKEPDYRMKRSHLDFVMNLNLSPNVIKAAMKEIWGAHEMATTHEWKTTSDLSAQKYSARDWNWKF